MAYRSLRLWLYSVVCTPLVLENNNNDYRQRNNNKYKLLLFCLDDESNTHVIQVQQYWTSIAVEVNRVQLETFGFINATKHLLTDDPLNRYIQRIEVHQKTPLIGFCNGDKIPTLKLFLKDECYRQQVVGILKKTNQVGSIDIEEILHTNIRADTQFLYDSNLKLQSWFDVTLSNDPGLQTFFDDNVQCHTALFRNIKRVSKKLDLTAPILRKLYIRIIAHSSTATQANQFDPSYDIDQDRVTQIAFATNDDAIYSYYNRSNINDDSNKDCLKEIEILDIVDFHQNEGLLLQHFGDIVDSLNIHVIVFASDERVTPNCLAYLFHRASKYGVNLHFSKLNQLQLKCELRPCGENTSVLDFKHPGIERVNICRVLMKAMVNPNLEGFRLLDALRHEKLIHKDVKKQYFSTLLHLNYHELTSFSSREAIHKDLHLKVLLLKKLEQHNEFTTSQLNISKICDTDLTSVVERGQQIRSIHNWSRMYHKHNIYVNARQVKKQYIVVRKPRNESDYPDPPWLENPPLSEMRGEKPYQHIIKEHLPNHLAFLLNHEHNNIFDIPLPPPPQQVVAAHPTSLSSSFASLQQQSQASSSSSQTKQILISSQKQATLPSTHEQNSTSNDHNTSSTLLTENANKKIIQENDEQRIHKTQEEQQQQNEEVCSSFEQKQTFFNQENVNAMNKSKESKKKLKSEDKKRKKTQTEEKKSNEQEEQEGIETKSKKEAQDQNQRGEKKEHEEEENDEEEESGEEEEEEGEEEEEEEEEYDYEEEEEQTEEEEINEEKKENDTTDCKVLNLEKNEGEEQCIEQEKQHIQTKKDDGEQGVVSWWNRHGMDFTRKRKRQKVVLTQEEEDKKKRFRGGLVLKPESGFYTKPEETAASLDFGSLYPSIIEANLLCYMRVLYDPKWLDDPRLKLEYVPITATECLVLAKSYDSVPVKTITPQIIHKIVKMRNDIRAEQKKYDEKSFKYKVLEGAQLAAKVVQNSSYGFIGSATSGMTCTALAAAVTQIGQWMNRNVRFVILFFGGFVYYGDTDSDICRFWVHSKFQTSDEIFQNVYDQASTIRKIAESLFAKPNKLNLENFKLPFLLTDKKKTYAAVEMPPKPESWKFPDTWKKHISGVTCKKRDKCHYAQTIGMNLLNRLLYTSESVDQYCGWLESEINKIPQGTINTIEKLNSFIVTCELNSVYKRKKGVLALTLADSIAKETGARPLPGTRLAYVSAYFPESTTLQRNGKKATKRLHAENCETPDYFLQNRHLIDIKYYLENQIFKCIAQILCLPVHKELLDALTVILNRVVLNWVHKRNHVRQITSFFANSSKDTVHEKLATIAETNHVLIDSTHNNKVDNAQNSSVENNYGNVVEQVIDKQEQADLKEVKKEEEGQKKGLKKSKNKRKKNDQDNDGFEKIQEQKKSLFKTIKDNCEKQAKKTKREKIEKSAKNKFEIEKINNNLPTDDVGTTTTIAQEMKIQVNMMNSKTKTKTQLKTKKMIIMSQHKSITTFFKPM